MIFLKILVGVLVSFTSLYADINNSSEDNMEQISTIILDESDNNRDINLTSKSYFTIKLNTQLGTGYDWYIMQISSNIVLIKEFVEKSIRTDSLMVGGKTQHYFQFQLLSKEEAKLKLGYKRIWEKNTTEAKIFQLQIHSDK